MNAQSLKPRLIVVAGPNGAGKTSITEQLRRHEWMGGCEYVNPDYIARDEFGDWNAPDAGGKAAVRAEEVRERCLREGRSPAFETVLSMPDKIDFIQRARHAGFVLRRHRQSRRQRQARCPTRHGRWARCAHQKNYRPLHPLVSQLLVGNTHRRPCLHLRQLGGQCAGKAFVPHQRRKIHQTLR